MVLFTFRLIYIKLTEKHRRFKMDFEEIRCVIHVQWQSKKKYRFQVRFRLV